MWELKLLQAAGRLSGDGSAPATEGPDVGVLIARLPDLEEYGPAERLLAHETAEQVRTALASLAPHYRDVLILCELSELSYAEAAQVCGIDIGTVRSRLSRARAQLADRLSRMGLMKGAGRVKEAS